MNWGLIDDKFVMLSFYNKTASRESLTLYKRNTKEPADFFSSIQFIIPEAGLRPEKAALIHSSSQSYLYLNSPSKPSAEGGLTLYNVTE